MVFQQFGLLPWRSVRDNVGLGLELRALDPLIRRKLQDELLILQERVRKTILFVSHDLDEALKLGDKVTILEGGRIVQTGTGRDIVERPADDYVAEFVRHVNPRTAIKGAAVSPAS
jgi:glycine betaine/proline transport system ATP-binding protein